MFDTLFPTALLRKSIKTLIATILMSNSLMAAENLPVKSNIEPYSLPENKKCSDNICLETSNKRVPDMFQKPDRFSQRERTDAWSTNDFDHSGEDVRLSISL